MSKFHYVYTAPTKEERKEISAIRSQYVEEKADDKLTRLRKLDKRVKNVANCVGLVVGIVGCLTFGLGMSLVLVWQNWLWGGLASALGGGVMTAAYPLYKAALKRGKEKYGEEILRISDELLQ